MHTMTLIATTPTNAILGEVRFFGITKTGEDSQQIIAVGYSHNKVVGVMFHPDSEFGSLFLSQQEAAPDRVLVAEYIKGTSTDAAERKQAQQFTGQRLDKLVYNVQEFGLSVSDTLSLRGVVAKGAVTVVNAPQLHFLPNTVFRCMSCVPLDLCNCASDARHLCVRHVDQENQVVLTYEGGQQITTADCPDCTLPMYRTGGTEKVVKVGSGRSTYKTNVTAPPASTFCLQCFDVVKMIDPVLVVNGKSIHYVGACKAGHRVGTPPSHTRRVILTDDALATGRRRLQNAARRQRDQIRKIEQREFEHKVEKLAARFSVGALR